MMDESVSGQPEAETGGEDDTGGDCPFVNSCVDQMGQNLDLIQKFNSEQKSAYLKFVREPGGKARLAPERWSKCQLVKVSWHVTMQWCVRVLNQVR